MNVNLCVLVHQCMRTLSGRCWTQSAVGWEKKILCTHGFSLVLLTSYNHVTCAIHTSQRLRIFYYTNVLHPHFRFNTLLVIHFCFRFFPRKIRKRGNEREKEKERKRKQTKYANSLTITRTSHLNLFHNQTKMVLLFSIYDYVAALLVHIVINKILWKWHHSIFNFVPQQFTIFIIIFFCLFFFFFYFCYPFLWLPIQVPFSLYSLYIKTSFPTEYLIYKTPICFCLSGCLWLSLEWNKICCYHSGSLNRFPLTGECVSS